MNRTYSIQTYPIHLHIAGKLCLVVGGGSVSERKVAGLLAAGARVRVVSPALTPGLQARAVVGEIEWVNARYEAAHLRDANLVFAATDNRAVNAQVATEADQRGVLVNVADAPEEGHFVTPSVVRRGALCLSVSTGGNHPMLAARICAELEARFSSEYGEFVELLGRMRDYIKTRTEEPALRRKALARLVDDEAELRALLRAGGSLAAQERAETLVSTALEC